MLTIGEFSKICEVSPNTLRYYAEIGLIQPIEVNQETGYRYYSVDQLEIMLYINRLKTYLFSLDEIKVILQDEDPQHKQLYAMMVKKKADIEHQKQTLNLKLNQIASDITCLKQGKAIMSYLKDIDVQMVDVPQMNLLSIRKTVLKPDFPRTYTDCFGSLFHTIQKHRLSMIACPMVLFHSDEFSLDGLDTEFAIPIQETVSGTRTFYPGVCLKTTLSGSYSDLPSIYTKQIKWAEANGYVNAGPLFECYQNSLESVSNESELITDVYYPVKKTVMSHSCE